MMISLDIASFTIFLIGIFWQCGDLPKRFALLWLTLVIPGCKKMHRFSSQNCTSATNIPILILSLVLNTSGLHHSNGMYPNQLIFQCVKTVINYSIDPFRYNIRAALTRFLYYSFAGPGIRTQGTPCFTNHLLIRSIFLTNTITGSATRSQSLPSRITV